MANKTRKRAKTYFQNPLIGSQVSLSCTNLLDDEISGDSPTNTKIFTHKYNTRRNCREESKMVTEDKLGDEEYSKVLIKCLKEAIEENEKVSLNNPT